MVTFRLRTNDDQVVEISEEALRQSITLRSMVEGTDMEDGSMEIPLGEVDGDTTKKIVEWCEHHKKDPAPEPEVHETGPRPSAPPFDMPSWDRQFLNKDKLSIPEMAKLITAANYLEVTWLYKFCCKRIFIDYIKDRPVAQLKEMFQPSDLIIQD
uniref:Skp1-related protein n=1 Tax=Steinernema glaseri TaxID=37863 RepID=A0A1I7YBW0_9BILA